VISFGTTTCAPNWRAPNPGVDHFVIANSSPRAATVYLFRSASGAIVATLRHSAPHSRRRLTVRLRPGFYSWGCDLDGYPRHVSDARKVPFHAQAGTAPSVIPVLGGELIAPMLAYREYVSALIATLRTQVAALVSEIDAGNVAGAESTWLEAHLTWLEIGQDDGAYGAFGELGRELDGTAAGLLQGISDPRFTGFHRVELDLFTLHDLTAAASDAQTLQSLVATLAAARLSRALPTTNNGLASFTLRLHEVLEDALRDSLSGEDDYGSGTDLASLAADVAATRELLSLFAPLLEPRAPHLVPRARRQLSVLLAAVRATRDNDEWVAVAELPPSERQRVDAAIGAALETLAPAADILAPVNST
jgi:high-affinity iron transporter